MNAMLASLAGQRRFPDPPEMTTEARRLVGLA